MGNKKGVILLTYCNPASGNLPSLEDEFMKVDFVFDKQEVTGCYDIKNYPITKVDHLRDSINKFKNELVVFSYSGHAEPEELLLDNSAAHGVSLMEMLASCPNLKLVLLNGCSTAKLAQKGQALGIPVLIGTNRSVPDRDATSFAVSLFNSLRDKNTTIRSAFDYSKSASRLENNPGNNRAGRTEGELEDQIWNYFSTDDSLMDETLYRLCYVPAQVVFENDEAGVPKVFFIHSPDGDACYLRIKDLAGLDNTPHIASGTIADAFVNGDSANFDWNLVTDFWKAADAVCFLASNVSFISKFWPTLSNQIEKLRNDYPKRFFGANLNVHKDNFSGFCEGLVVDGMFPEKKQWNWTPSIQAMEREPSNVDVGHQDFIMWLKDKISAQAAHLKNKLQIFNYDRQQYELNEDLDSETRQQFIILEGSANCGQELLIKRLLERNELNFNIQHNKLQRLDFSGEEIQSAEQLWERIGATAAGKTVRQDIVQEVANRLQNQHLVIVLNRVHSAERDNGQLPQTRLILETFWQEWTAAFADVDTPHRLVIVAINRGYDEESGSGKLELTQKKQDKHHLLPLSPIRLLKGNYGKNTISDWHRNHNDGVFSPMEYQKLDNQRDSVLQDPHIKNVVHKICAVYQCEHICDQLFQL